MARKSRVEKFCEEVETDEEQEVCRILQAIPEGDEMLRRAVLRYAESARKSTE